MHKNRLRIGLFLTVTFCATDTVNAQYNLPFIENFDNPERFTQWTIHDLNQDGSTWVHEQASQWNTYPMGGSGGCTHVSTGGSWGAEIDQANDLLISPAIAVSGGSLTLSFYAKQTGPSKETLVVLIGQNTDPDQMQVIDTLYDFSENNVYTLWTFNIPDLKAGNYHIGFYAISDYYANTGICLDNLSLESGSVCDIAVNQVLLPASGCGLDQIEVQAEIELKQGNLENETISAWYQINNGAKIPQDFDIELAEGRKSILHFNSLASLIAGNSYTISVGIEPLNTEKETSNNQSHSSITHFVPVQSPHHFDFQQQEMSPVPVQAWEMDMAGAMQCLQSDALLQSSCIELEAGLLYRLSYQVQAGDAPIGLEEPDFYHIDFGLSGQTENWETVFSDTAYTDYSYQSREVILRPTQDGLYAFSFKVDSMPSNLFFREVEVSTVPDYDLKMKVLRAPSIFPVKQVSAGIGSFVTIMNHGRLSIDPFLLEFSYQNGNAMQACGHDTFAIGAFSSELQAAGFCRLPAAFSDSIAHIQAKISIPSQEDANPQDNSTYFDVQFNDTTFAYDQISTDMFSDAGHAVGAQDTVACGLPFLLSCSDTLTSVSIAWGPKRSEFKVGIEIRQWDLQTQTFGALAYYTEVTRPEDSGWATYPIPALVLNPGAYMISACQLGRSSFGLIADRSDNGIMYLNKHGEVLGYQDNLGYPGIRANFGHSDSIMESIRDVAVTSILRPASDGIFSSQESIVAEIMNTGNTNLENVPVYCYVNKELLPSKSIDIKAFEKKTIEFTADLSQPSTAYYLSIFTQLEGDQNPHNDTASIWIRSLDSINPYILDFELCQDFAIDHFQPAWRTVDMDTLDTYEVEIVTGQGSFPITYPNLGGKMAFMAFNPSAVNPDVSEFIPPFQGNKYGACIGTNQSNDWLISPRLLLPDTNPWFAFAVRKASPFEELYNVLISTTDDTPANFLPLASKLQPSMDWEEKIFDLTPYAGQEVYLAIQCVSEGGYMFMIDNLRVSEPGNSQPGPDPDPIPDPRPDTTDIQLASIHQVQIYPNPASELLHIRCQPPIKSIRIYSLSGCLMYHRDGSFDQDPWSIPLENLPAGLYLLYLQTENSISVQKFVKR